MLYDLLFFTIDPSFRFTEYLTNPTLLRLVPEHVSDITVLGRKVFVTKQTSHVKVYDSHNFTLTRNIKIPGGKSLTDIISYINCFHVYGSRHKIIHRYDLSNKVTTQWRLTEECRGLSVSKRDNILVSLCNMIEEYTTHGLLIRKISLDASIDKTTHCVLLSTGNFVVSHEGDEQHRVCIVDTSGDIIQSYGGSPGSRIGQLNYPCQLVVDKHDNVIVCDSDNSRVQLLSPTLAYLGDIVIPRHQLDKPCTLHFDELNHCLFIGEWSGK